MTLHIQFLILKKALAKQNIKIEEQFKQNKKNQENHTKRYNI
jgi:hypothetical protein